VEQVNDRFNGGRRRSGEWGGSSEERSGVCDNGKERVVGVDKGKSHESRYRQHG
jgi:hypothetical protein